MSFDNEIKIRILYWGAKDSGKTTNIQWLKKIFKNLGKTVTLFGEDGFTICFEFLEPVVKLKNFYDVKYLIYSSPGEEAPKLTHDIFSQGIDSIVFVVDSRKSRLEDNKKALSRLLELLEEYKGKSGEIQIPMVVQYNKLDLPDALPVEKLKRELNLEKHPGIEAEVINGKGVIETFTKIARESLKAFIRRNKSSP
jgi:signal recognition particle receptor subunit beta